MKYKGIELEGLDKKVKLSHSRVMETDEGTDWIDKLLTCDKAALTPTQFHEVSAFPVWVRGEGWVDAAFALRGEIEDIAVAGFTAALKEGSVHLSAVPVSGDEDAPGMVMLEKVVRD